MELLVHINKRVKSRPKVLLPVTDLIAQYADPSVEPFVTVTLHKFFFILLFYTMVAYWCVKIHFLMNLC